MTTPMDIVEAYNNRLLEVPDFPLLYQPETGLFFWSQDVGKKKKGSLAGSLNKSLGYWTIRYLKKLYYAHRLAFLARDKKFPEQHVDHINGIKSDNRLSNLRLATPKQNLAYRGKPKNNKSGQKGVYWAARDKVWIASFAGKKLGQFKNFEEACEVYKRETKKLLGDFYYDT